MLKRHPHNLTRSVTSTMNMGINYPTIPVEVFPGDSFRMQIRNLSRFLPLVAPTMHDVNINVETYQVPWRQLFDKLGISWDDFLTGGEDGMTVVEIPQLTTPSEGYEPGTLADFLGIPTNFMDMSVTPAVKVVQGSITVNALPVIAYMHIINENYRDQNFIKKLDLTQYQAFLDGTYEFEDASGNSLGYDLFRPGAPGLFPRAWARDYYGRSLPNTQRGPVAQLPLGGNIRLDPPYAPVFSTPTINMTPTAVTGTNQTPTGVNNQLGFTSPADGTQIGTIAGWPVYFQLSSNLLSLGRQPITGIPALAGTVLGQIQSPLGGTVWQIAFVSSNSTSMTVSFTRTVGSEGNASFNLTFTATSGSNTVTSGTAMLEADLSSTIADLTSATSSSIIEFRLAARMQAFGEKLQQAGARAVEYTMAFFGVRIPDDRIQRPIYHGAFRMPLAFSEVLQTSQSSSESPLATLGGHGITGGVNKPLHIKCIEHGYIIQIISCMPRSQFHNILPRLYLRKTRFDIPNPVFAHAGEQAVDQIEIYPRTATPDKRFGYVPRYSELGHLPSTVHGHMKDTFAHWHMARIYTTEPQLSAAFRYELPTNRSFAVQGEDQIQMALGIILHSRRPFAKNPRPGIHIV